MPKTLAHLWPQVTAFGNLWDAWHSAARGKRSSPEVVNFDGNAESNLLDLQRALHDGTYAPGGYRSFLIHDPKRRWVSAAPFVDRVVHHALVRVIEPGFERSFIGDSYANRTGKGTHAAVERAHGWAKHYRYVLQCDLRQFFSERGSCGDAANARKKNHLCAHARAMRHYFGQRRRCAH